MANSSLGAKASGRWATAWASRPAASSQSGRSWPRRSAQATAHRRLWYIEDEPVRRAYSSKKPEESSDQAIEPSGRCHRSTKSMPASTAGHSCSRPAKSPVETNRCQAPVAR